MKYKLYPKFLSHETCSYFLQYAKDNFIVDYRTTKGWKARTNTNKDFENEVIDIISPIIKDTSYDVEWINLTEYTVKNQLRLHTDTRSNKTIICNIRIVLKRATASASLFVSPIFSPRALAHNLHIFLISLQLIQNLDIHLQSNIC